MQMHPALALAARGEAIGSVIIVDLDRFKVMNDTYRHAAGDIVLQAVAEWLKDRVRETDTIDRLGGDEFAVLMPGVSHEIAEQWTDTLIRNLNGHSLHWNGVNIPISASVGLTHYAVTTTRSRYFNAPTNPSISRNSRTKPGAKPLKL